MLLGPSGSVWRAVASPQNAWYHRRAMWYRIQRLVLPRLSQASTAELKLPLAERDNLVAQLQAGSSKDIIPVCSVVASCVGQRL